MSFWFYLFVGSAVFCSILSFWSISRQEKLRRRCVDRLATCRLTGYEVARILLNENGLNNVFVEKAQISSGAALSPQEGRRGIVHLPPEIFDGNSLRAIATSAHKCGYAVQYYLGGSSLLISRRAFALFWILIGSGFFLLNFSFVFLSFMGSEFFLIPLCMVILGGIPGVCYIVAKLKDESNATRYGIRMLEIEKLIESQETSFVTQYLQAYFLKSVSDSWLFASLWNFVMAGVILCHTRSVFN
jgi:Zn-dependent membrane protease YugP